MAGANYQAGYAFAATLIAIAEAGEAGAAGDAHWATVNDDIWGKDLIPALAAGGVLEGGDWPEGWQYGPLSVTEHALAARAMQDNGSTIPGADVWASSLVTRFMFGLTPAAKQAYAAGDSDNDTPNREPENGALVAAMAGPASAEAKAWARSLNTSLGLENENALFDALAVASGGPSTEPPTNLPLNHLAKGAGNWYLRSNWSEAGAWSVFQCTHRLVDDHQHNDAGNFVLTRGGDDLVVDPSPYGTLSTMTGNAPAVDTDTLPSGYSPSQGNWGRDTRLAWARQSSSGVAAARCDYADQFRYEDYDSDVSVALRDYVLVPDGNDSEIVLVDRVVTAGAGRDLHLRVRTSGNLSLASDRAVATIGDSSLAVERVWSSSGSGTVRDMPQASECPSSDHTCDVSRIPSGTEYRLDVTGPEAMALHVIAARPGAAAAPAHAQLSGDGYRGVVVPRAGTPVVVIASDSPDGEVGSSFAYRAQASALHVVLDAPVGASGTSDVTATRDGADCAVSVTPHAGATGGFPAEPLVVALDADCAVTDDGSQMEPEPTNPPPPDGLGGAAGEGQGPSPSQAGADDGGQPSSGGVDPISDGSGATGGTTATGGAPSVGSGGSTSNGSSTSVAASAGTPPVGVPSVPVLDACSVSPRGADGGPGGTLASALVGLALVNAKRRRRGARR
jgi:hypothetical protein